MFIKSVLADSKPCPAISKNPDTPLCLLFPVINFAANFIATKLFKLLLPPVI